MAAYNCKKTVLDGKEFSSETESRRYRELKLLERAGEISYLQLQPEFVFFESFRKCPECHTITDLSKRSTLCPNCKTKMKTINGMKYIADFQYLTKEGKTIVEDVKGPEKFRTEKFKHKSRIFEWLYPNLTLTVVTTSQIRH